MRCRQRAPVRGDVVYLDPPYVGTFDGYTSDGFNNEQQDRLLTMASGWTADGVAGAVLMTRSFVPEMTTGMQTASSGEGLGVAMLFAACGA